MCQIYWKFNGYTNPIFSKKKRQDESNGIYCYPISETDFQTILFEIIPANTTLPLDLSGWIFNEVTVTIYRHIAWCHRRYQ